MNTIPRRRALSALGAMLLSPRWSYADAWPAKPIRMVHGFGAGATIDIVARPLAQELSAVLGQAVVVEGRPGATGTIANELVVRSPADGYTLLIAPLAAVVTAAHLFPIRYRPLQDLVPIIQVARFDTVLVVGPSVQARNLAELIATAKAKPGALTYASSGIGTGFHLAGELLQQTAGVKMSHVPYSAGGRAATTDLLSGRVDMMFESIGAMQPYLSTKRLRALAVTGTARSLVLPDVPTIAEAGLPGAEIGGWHGVFAPAGTPPAILAKMNDAVTQSLSRTELRKLWESMDFQFTPNSPVAFAEQVRKDDIRYGKLIAAAGIKIS